MTSGSQVRRLATAIWVLTPLQRSKHPLPSLRLAGLHLAAVAWPGGVLARQLLLIGRHRRRTRRRCRWRAGPDCRGRGRISWWSGDRRGRRLLARPAARPQRPARRWWMRAAGCVARLAWWSPHGGLPGVRSARQRGDL